MTQTVESASWSPLPGDSALAASSAVHPHTTRPSPAHPPRVMLYSHDTMGLGHMRRNLLIGQRLSRSPIGANVLLVAGAREVNQFTLPHGVDSLTLPSLYKSVSGRYCSRRLQMSTEDLISLRARTLEVSARAYDPDILIVDNVPRGAVNELDMTLQALKERGRTKCVLGLRDVLDEPAAVRHEWSSRGYADTVDRYFAQVWVYGDRGVYDFLDAYGFGEDIADKLTYTGYLDPACRLTTGTARTQEMPWADGEPYTLCMVGGGQDGVPLAQAFAQAIVTRGVNGLLVSGPCMDEDDRARLRGLAGRHRNFFAMDFVSEPFGLMQGAERIVSMGGYNSTCEVLRSGRPAFIVPRTRPRREQWVRVNRLHDLGLVETCSPAEVTAARLANWITGPVPPSAASHRIDFGGLDRVAVLVAELLNAMDLPPRWSPLT